MTPKIISKVEAAPNRHWKNFIAKDYLGSHNLEQGEEMIVTIAKIEKEKVIGEEGKKQEALVLYFTEEVPKMILNITNGETIEALYGSHPETWVDKQVQIFVKPDVKSFGKTVPGLRIRPFVPNYKLDTTPYIAQLDQASSLPELKQIWESLPKPAQADKDLVAYKDLRKAALSTAKND